LGFLNFFFIHRDIRKSRCKFATGVNDTGSSFAAGVNNTGGQIAIGINNTGGKFATDIRCSNLQPVSTDTRGKLPLVSMTPKVNLQPVSMTSYILK
jgi:hypothetical protein